MPSHTPEQLDKLKKKSSKKLRKQDRGKKSFPKKKIQKAVKRGSRSR